MEKNSFAGINWKALIISLALSLGTGVVSSLLSGGGMQMYQNMYQPPLAPPGWLFPIVWTILYVLMGIAAYLIYEEPVSGDRRLALLLYGVQLFFNGVWSLIFFGAQAYFLAFAWLVLLWFFIYLTAKQFLQLNKTAGILMMPYLLWVTFAGYLNLAIAIYYNMQ